VREDLVENEDWSNVKGNTIVPKGKRRISGYDDVKTFNFNWRENDTVTKSLVDVLEETIDEKYYLSDERVKQLKFNDKVQKGDIKQVAQYDTDKRENSNRFRTYDVEGIGPGLSTMGGGGLEPCITVLGNTSKTGYRSHDVHGTNGISPTIQARDYKGPKQIAIRESIRINKGIRINPLRGKSSNGWHFAQQVHDPKGISRAVKAGGGSGNIPKTFEGLRIRKLTPLECFRLQGFTDEQFYKAKN